jgi:hypothetical protein
VTLGFRREVDENCTLLGYYTASSGNFLLTVRDNLSVPSYYAASSGNFLLTVRDNLSVPSYYTASSGNSFPSFRDNLSVPSSRVKDPSGLGFLTVQDGMIRLVLSYNPVLSLCVRDVRIKR